MRRRQRKKAQERERERDERHEQEAREEFEMRIQYEVSFGEPTLSQLEDVWEIYQVVVVEGANWKNRRLKVQGILTPDGIELQQKLRREASLE